MARRFLTSINLSPQISDPVTGSEGDAYFNSSLNVIRVYYDGQWHDAATAELIDYDNSNSELISVNIKAAIDELSLSKVNKSELSSNINLYPTTVNSSISGYKLMVSSLDDENYDNPAVNIPTGAINSTSQLLASLSSSEGIITGNPGVINVTTIGNIRKTSGNSNAFAEFFFKVFHRNQAGVETLLGTSDTTGAVNPALNNYLEFSASAVTTFISFLPTDRIIIKYYANILSGSSPEYDFQFGGVSPVRSLLPVPLSVIPASSASSIILDTTNFDKNLSGSDSTVQSALDTLDNLDVNAVVESGSSYPTANLTNGKLFYNTQSGRTAIYFNSVWKELEYVSPLSTVTVLDGGNSSTTEFSHMFDGGNSSTPVFIGNIDGD